MSIFYRIVGQQQIKRCFLSQRGFCASPQIVNTTTENISTPDSVSDTSTTSSGSVRHTKTHEKYGPMNIHKALSLVKAMSWAKFDETIELSLNMGLDPRKPNQSVKGTAKLPSGTGKVTRICVFASGSDAKDALDAGADVVGAEDLIPKFQAGDFKFDTVIATPELMPLVGKIGRVINCSLSYCCVSYT